MLAAALLVLLVARWRLIDTLSINWDEFHFLAQVHSYLRGELAARLLTFHVHLFSWAPAVSTNEGDQVIAVRRVMFVLSLITTACVGFIAWRMWRSVVAASFAVFAGQSISYVLQHGSAARFDPLVAMSVAVAACFVVHKITPDVRTTARARFALLAAGVALGFGAVISIKVALFLPALVALLFSPVAEARRPGLVPGPLLRAAFVDVASLAASSLVTFLGLYGWHVSHLARLAEPAATTPTAASPGGSSLLDILSRQVPGEVLPNPDYLVLTLRWDVFFWLLVAAALALAFHAVGRGGDARRDAIRALCFALPLVSLAFYRNAFSYFYVCVIPLVSVLVAYVIARLDGALSRRRVIAALVIVLLAVPSAVRARRWLSLNGDDQVTPQRTTIDVVHRVFPTPVPYVDRCGMIGSFPKVGPFMTTWVLEDYREDKDPIMPELLAKHRPHMLVQNVETLELGKSYGNRESRRLLKDDFVTLKEAFIPHWGPVWVAGKTISLAAGSETFELAITGPYVVELNGAAGDAHGVTLDGIAIRHGMTMDLAAGEHVVAQPVDGRRDGELTLRIATARPPPKDVKPPSPRSIFGSLGFKAK